MVKKKNGIPFGSVKRNQRRKRHNMHMIVMYIDLEHVHENGEDTTNYNIEEVDKSTIPDFNLLVGGFPCQDYSVASSLATSKGLEGKKGILWWSIRETVEKKQPPFILLENVDRLLKSPAKQRGRDFGIIIDVSEMKDICLVSLDS